MSVRLSVIVPTRNRASRVADLLDSLARQQPVAFEWEVVVVDNASTDDTAAVVQRKSTQLPIAIRCVREAQLGLHQGRHRGAQAARGEILGFLDDDMILAPTWIQGSELVANGTADAVVGRILPQWEASPPAWVSRFTTEGVCPYLGLIDLGGARKSVDPLMVFGGNCFIGKERLFALGGFHPDGVPSDQTAYRGDGETGLMLKFRAQGLRAAYEPLATAYHVIGAERLTVEYLCRRSFNEGVSNSFTETRARSWSVVTPQAETNATPRWKRVARRIVTEPAILAAYAREVGVRAARAVRAGVAALSPFEGAVIERRVRRAYLEGRTFHERALAADPALRQYVLREHYLPEGGEWQISA